MPSTYTHFRFGNDVKNNLADRELNIINNYPELYLIGLHGPDILFYFNAIFKNPVNTTGFATHDKSGKEFFENAKQIILSCDDDEAAFAYAYGVLCHFALDMTAHPYIEKRVVDNNVTHAETEGDLDRHYLVEDGLDPIQTCLVNHIVPSKENAIVIKQFYTDISTEQVFKSLEDMIFYNKLLMATSTPKRDFIYLLMKLAGRYDDMQGIVLREKENENCIDGIPHLEKLYDVAKTRAVDFISSYYDYVYSDVPLDELFDKNFEGILVTEE